MKATRIFHDKALLPEGLVVEMTIWRLPGSNQERPHGLKYSLFCGRPGERLVCYDNERGKGDHRHVQGVESPYKFHSPERLIDDFLADVAAVRQALAKKEQP